MRISLVMLISCFCCGSAGAEALKIYSGRVQAFEIITAIRNYGFREGMRPAQVAIAVNGGTQADWLATAAYVAEKSIVSDVTFAEVEVYTSSKWGDLPPTRVKQLAKAYYGGANPLKSPWPDDPFSIFAVGRAPSMADVEFEELSSQLLDSSSKSNDPEEASNAADAAALVMIRSKYRLPPDWKPNDDLGMTGVHAIVVKRSQVNVVADTSIDASVAALERCLTILSSAIFRGCQDRSQKYVFQP